ncbi:MAG: tRNA (guanosine(46)-N7)-methyltransferase TrmB [Bacteroidia bacterium]
MTKRKLQRFAELDTFSTVIHPLPFQNPVQHDLSGRWNVDFFEKEQPIVLEIGCGRGEYTINLAQRYLHKNFIGIDIKGARIWRGGKTAHEQQMKNVGFLRITIDRLEYYFAKEEINEIWITFPDPHPKLSRQNKRLTSPLYLDRYQQILGPGGIMHLKTDHEGLFDYTLETIKERNAKICIATKDLYNSEFLNEDLEIKTTYEQKFLLEGKKICYLKWKF